jgi:hypothetical protein
MESQIKWEKDLKTAIGRARAGKKQVLLFFHNPN